MQNKIVGFKDENHFLSNFFYVAEGIKFEGMYFPYAENAFQSAKTTYMRSREQFVHIRPSEAKSLGRNVRLRSDWEEVKIDVMYEIVKAKFSVPRLKEMLLATGDSELIEENTWGDTYWGTCRNKGLNHLGKILMRVREELRNE